jgi:hypothetical protein
MSIYIAGACSVPGCPYDPPKESNPFCQDHWTRLPGRLRRRLSTVWKSRTKGHHGKVVKGHDWTKAIAAGVRFFGALPRNELPRIEQEAEERLIAERTREILEAGAQVPTGAIADDALAVQRQIREERRIDMTPEPKVEADGYIHAAGKKYTPDGYRRWREGLKKGTAAMQAHYADRATPVPELVRVAGNGHPKLRRAIKLIHNGQPNDVVVATFKDWLLERYMQDLPKPKPEEIFAAGMLAGVERERAGR